MSEIDDLFAAGAFNYRRNVLIHLTQRDGGLPRRCVKIFQNVALRLSIRYRLD
jgi:hypothetical protein